MRSRCVKRASRRVELSKRRPIWSIPARAGGAPGRDAVHGAAASVFRDASVSAPRDRRRSSAASNAPAACVEIKAFRRLSLLLIVKRASH